MGFFDRFKRQGSAKGVVQPEIQSDVALIFQPVGNFEMASCPGGSALMQLDRLRDEGRSEDFTAILLGGADDVEALAENRDFFKSSTNDHLRLAADFNIERWLNERIEADPELYQAEPGNWPSEIPDAGGVSAHLEVLSKKPKSIVYLAKIPTAQNWEAPAYIGMGGWNECPDATGLTACSKHWHERYGAEIVSITHDVVEFTVARPPATKEEALTLAKEQHIFCFDIVDQGVGSVSALAATLLNSKYWYFWWD